MGKVHMCTGDYATTPYCFDSLGVRVFSAEELCYVLKENAFFLDRDIIDRRLVKWIEETLKLPALAAALYPLLRKKTSAGSFAGIILDYVGLYDSETVRRTEAVYRNGDGLNVYEKQKSRVDYLLSNEKYALALEEYGALLEQLPEGERTLTSQILHNRGVAFGGLFLFELAAEAFMDAYRLSEDPDELVAFLGAKRMQLTDKEYVAFLSSSNQYYEAGLTLEKLVEEVRTSYETSIEKQETDQTLLMHGEDNAGYYSAMNERIFALQNVYRANIKD